MLSPAFQNAIPLTNWMFPVISYQSLPDSFRLAPRPKTAVELDRERVGSQNAAWLKAWSRKMSE